ncbi:hypothetical protein [uncultured Microbulbifer sp.]|uniref:hypothetical protein n=1 Tax=uncultured Microbulbifer sp. TaxID=348147 RepID=UPI0025DF3BE9|nr:hypothetical protein [uncultured Microbulbifer sp.]
MNNNGLNVIRVLFQIIEGGDRRKFQALSNDSDTGGGARDLRFRPESEFWPFFEKVFPDRQTTKRTSKGSTTTIEVLSGTIHWDQLASAKHATLEVWPATNARPNESRFSKISRLDMHDLIVDDPNGGKSIFMLFQQQNGVIRVHFTTETSLRNDNWDPTIKKFAKEWLDSGSKSAFLDLVSKRRYPNV